MRSLKMTAVTAVAVFALSAVAVASASAAEFTAEKSGELHGHATSEQVFTIDSGTWDCETAATEGEAKEGGSPSQEVTVHYSNCTALTFVEVKISPATYEFTAEGMDNKVHILNTITIQIPLAGCTLTVPPQTVGTVTFENDNGNLIENSEVDGIHYHGSGGFCGNAEEKTDGTYEGSNTVEGPAAIGFDE